MWAVVFENQQSGKKQYREYPVIANLETRVGLYKMLQSRKFLDEYMAISIQQYDPLQQKLALGKLFGELIYS